MSEGEGVVVQGAGDGCPCRDRLYRYSRTTKTAHNSQQQEQELALGQHDEHAAAIATAPLPSHGSRRGQSQVAGPRSTAHTRDLTCARLKPLAAHQSPKRQDARPQKPKRGGTVGTGTGTVTGCRARVATATATGGTGTQAWGMGKGHGHRIGNGHMSGPAERGGAEIRNNKAPRCHRASTPGD